MHPEIDICGVAEFPQGRTTWPSTMALHEALVRAALDDAGLGLDDVDVLFTTEPRSDAYLIHAAALAERLRIAPARCWSYESGGGVPIVMLEAAHNLLALGNAKAAVVVAADLPLTSVSRDRYVANLAQVGPVHPEFETPYQPAVPSMFALVARRYLAETGLDEKAFYQVALHDRAMAARHPNAHMREPITSETYQASRMISDPLRLLDCAPVSDGGGAVVIARRDGQTDRKRPRIGLKGVGAAMSHLHLSAAESLTEFAAGDAIERALDAAGVGREALDIALIYDCFSIAMLVNLEDMGLAPRGQAASLFASGHFGLEGDLPVNTHGGLLSHGHPARAGGMGNLVEAIVQLRGEGDSRQVPDCALALVHGMGGVFATHAACILGREDA